MEDTARSIHQKTKKEILKFKDKDPISLIRKEKFRKDKAEKGFEAFFC